MGRCFFFQFEEYLNIFQHSSYCVAAWGQQPSPVPTLPTTNINQVTFKNSLNQKEVVSQASFSRGYVSFREANNYHLYHKVPPLESMKHWSYGTRTPPGAMERWSCRQSPLRTWMQSQTHKSFFLMFVFLGISWLQSDMPQKWGIWERACWRPWRMWMR